LETEKVSFFENFEFGNGTKDFSSFGENSVKKQKKDLFFCVKFLNFLKFLN